MRYNNYIPLTANRLRGSEFTMEYMQEREEKGDG
jgi:hypothetical protein